MSGNQQQFDKRLRAALQDQAEHITLSDAALQGLARVVVHRVQADEAARHSLRDLWQRMWCGTTFISWRALFRVGAVVVILVAVLVLYVSGIANVDMPARVHADQGISTLLMEEAPPFTAGPGKGW